MEEKEYPRCILCKKQIIKNILREFDCMETCKINPYHRSCFRLKQKQKRLKAELINTDWQVFLKFME